MVMAVFSPSRVSTTLDDLLNSLASEVAREHDLGRFVEQLGVRLRDVEPAEGPGRPREYRKREQGAGGDASLEAIRGLAGHRVTPWMAGAVQANRRAGRMRSISMVNGERAISAR